MSSKTEFEEQLVIVGKKLLRPSTTLDALLPLLDDAEAILSRVEQSPSRPLQAALSLPIKALVEDGLMRHSDMDVRVAVASCISEITRITAPDAPYDDDTMKDVFQLIVFSFENISDLSSRSYSKRISILETVSKVRLCVVMLDLNCDDLISEMFRHFMDEIRDYHPESIFSSMETIMTVVLEESEEISMELIHPILASVKKDNQEILPVARRLGERVIENSVIKLRTYMMQAVESNWISLDDYNEVISNLCEGTGISHCNGPASTGELKPNSNNGAVDAEETKKAECGDLENADRVDSDLKQEKSVKNNGRKSKSLVKRTKPSTSLSVKRRKGAEGTADHNIDYAKDIPDTEQPLIEAKDVSADAPSSSQSASKAKSRRSRKETLNPDGALLNTVKGKGVAIGAKRNKLDASEKKEGRKQDQEKATPEKDTTSSYEDDKGLVSQHKPISRLAKDEDQINESNKSSKRKRSSGKDKVIDTRDYDTDLVGSKVKVWWPKDKKFYEGVIDSYNSVEKKHKILYNDGDEENLNLKKERWELIEDSSEVNEEQKIGQKSSGLLTKMPKKKKPEVGSDLPSTKQENTEPSRDMESLSSKIKGRPKKLAQNSTDGRPEKMSKKKGKSTGLIKKDGDKSPKQKTTKST